MKNIVLIGFMGTGKTSVGRLLAGRLRWTFVDIDKKIEAEQKMTIAEIFTKHGEEYFRQKEREMISRISRYRSAVIATGGGVVLFPESMNRLRSTGIIIALTASVANIVERTGRRNTRPLLDRPDRAQFIAELLHKRAGLYRQADYSINTDHSSPHQTVDKIIAFLGQEGHSHVRSPGGSAERSVHHLHRTNRD
ncbi:MAG: shikimate kinase [Negativicutes bacterium]|nr:shikimate kinase [Negativicutes bacterium]